MSDTVVAGLFIVVAALVAASGAVIAAMAQRNYKQGQEIRFMVNGELTRTRHQVEVLTKQLQILRELGVISSYALAEAAADDEIAGAGE